MEYRRAQYMQRLIDRMGNGLVKVVTGIRRSGKSYLLFRLFKKYLLEISVKEDHILALELDTRENRPYRNPDTLLEYLRHRMQDDGQYYILLDEVQMLEDFEEVLNSLLRKPNVDIYVTGSNSRFLSRDVITEFRGRGDEIHIFPLSFGEFRENRTDDAQISWAEYVTYGGLPLVATMKTDEQKATYLAQLFRETYLKDIVERYRVERRQEMEDLLDILASSVGSLTNPSKIAATFKSRLNSAISLNTIKQYIDYLRDAFLINEAQRYDVKGRKYIGTPLKYYFEDVGLRNARLNFRQVEETHLMENVIYNELRMRGYNVDVGSVTQRQKEAESGKTLAKQLEVDFVANLGRKRYYLQSAFRLPDKDKIEQEKASLLALRDSFKKIIIVKDIIKPQNDTNGILLLSLFDFLLHRDSLDL